jgi:hypothetical protein
MLAARWKAPLLNGRGEFSVSVLVPSGQMTMFLPFLRCALAVSRKSLRRSAGVLEASSSVGSTCPE